MELTKNQTLNNIVKALCLCIMIGLTLISIFCYRADVSQFGIFAAFIIFYVQLPGHFILRMVRIRFRNLCTTLIVSFFTGWAFSILMYFITELIHTNVLLYVAGPLFSALYILARYLNRTCDPVCGIHFSRLPVSLFIFITLAYAYALFNTQYLYMSPELSEYVYMNPDKGYHIGLITSLSHGWPLVSPWVQGVTVNYHLFTEILYSIPVRLFGLTAYDLLLSCGPFLTVYAFGLSIYTMFKEMTAKAERAGLYSLLFMLSNIFIAKGAVDSLAFFFIFRNENATGYGVSCMMITVVIFKYWQEHSSLQGGFHKESVLWLLLLTMFIMMATGIKGPMGMVMLAAIWGTFLIGFIMRKARLRSILPLLVLTVGFLIVYIEILGSKGTSNGSGQSIIAFAKIADVTFYKSSLTALMKGIGLPKVIRLGLLLIVFMIFTLTAFVIPFTAGYIREMILVFSGKKEYDFSRVMVYAAVLVGFAAMFILNYSGHSQVYFGYVGIFLSPLISFWFFEDMEDNRSVIMKLVRLIFVISIAITSVTLALYYVEMYQDAHKEVTNTTTHSRYECMSRSEYQAMIWIRDHTPKDSLLAVDRYYSCPLDEYSYEDRWANRFFLYADYSNRFTYISGSGYNLPASDGGKIRQEMIETNNKLYDVTNQNRGALARKIGVDYIVVSKHFTDLPDLSNKDYELCFTNRGVDIYKVK